MGIRPPSTGADPRGPSVTPPASSTTTPPAPARGVTRVPGGDRVDLRPPDVAGGLRILVEEIRSTVLERLLVSGDVARSLAQQSPLSLEEATAGNASAATLRWLQGLLARGATAPFESLVQAIAEGQARAATELARLAAPAAVVASVDEAGARLQSGLQQSIAPLWRGDLPVAAPREARRRRSRNSMSERVEPVVREDSGEATARDETSRDPPRERDA